MFEITPEDINQLDDIDLRTLVARLCEAELESLGLSPAAVTWGGNQTAADGGLDVRVELPPGTVIDGFIPRSSTGFQVKKPDMPRGEITLEMRPKGALRYVIQELANDSGSYVIVSSTGSTADGPLKDRRQAMRDAVKDAANEKYLHTDFYDRTRIATWVRRHPGLVAWTRERAGRALVGWHAYKAWAGGTEDVNAEYLLDDSLRLHLGSRRNSDGRTIAEAIDNLRDMLNEPGQVVRLVGLSGVGKTRLVQALFDKRVGARPLASSLAVYTNLSDNPDPQPIGLATNLIANSRRAVLIVDNCGSDLHRRLSDLCRAPDSTISVLTVEYDIRDELPEGTEVVVLDTSSPELIETLVQRRYPKLSQVDARSIAEASGGNARIAIAIAEAVRHTGSIAGLSNGELFDRLFHQRNTPNEGLLRAAQACSLVYSFQGEDLETDEAELPRLATLAGLTDTEIFRQVRELLRRDLVQQRGEWRAVLPHAIANHLATRALEEVPHSQINHLLVDGGSERLARSFSRRLSFLHDNPQAEAIVRNWLSPNGRLGNVATFNTLELEMFENVAPVLPEDALSALERSGLHVPAVTASRRHLELLRSLAYESHLFERSALLMVKAATHAQDELDYKEAKKTFASLFTIYLSGTHASIEQRLNLIERLLKSYDDRERSLGLRAMEAVLEAQHFSSDYQFQFGARQRNYGFEPQGWEGVKQWFVDALNLIDRLAFTEGILKAELRGLFERKFQGLWIDAAMYEQVERLARQFAAEGFWPEGWAACRRVLKYCKENMSADALSKLTTLEDALRPTNLTEQVRAIVLGNATSVLDLEDMPVDEELLRIFDRPDAIALQLGSQVAVDRTLFEELLPELIRGGIRISTFGRGLATATTDPQACWARLADGFERGAPEQRKVAVLIGFLAKLWELNPELEHQLLDSTEEHPALLEELPALHSAVQLDERSVQRLIQALSTGVASVWKCQSLATYRTIGDAPSCALRDLLLTIARQTDGFDVAMAILSTRLYWDRTKSREHEPELLATGRELLLRVQFRNENQHPGYELDVVATACLVGPDSGPVAREVTERLKQAVAKHEIYVHSAKDLLTALFKREPLVVLDTLLACNEEEYVGIRMLRQFDDDQDHPLDAIASETLITWCNADPERRYELVASIIKFAHRPEPKGPLIWSGHAATLLANAPDRMRVLEAFIVRFKPSTWSGSRATQMETNARLLDSLEAIFPAELMDQVSRAKSHFAQEVERERVNETARDRTRHERFE